METIKAKYDVLKFISNIADVAKDSKLNEDIFENLAPELAALSNYLKISPKQALAVAITFTLNANNDDGSVYEYKKYFDCNPIKVLELQKDFPELVEKGILSISKCALRGRSKNEFSRNEYIVSDQIVKSILKNEMPNLSVRPDELDIFEVLEKIYKLSQEREEGVISTSELFKTFKKHLATYAHFPLIKHIAQLNFEEEDAYLFILLCWKSLLGEESINLIRTLENIFDRPNDLIHYSQGIICEENALMKRGFIERFDAYFFNSTEIKLTQQSIDFLEKENIKLLNKKGNESNCLILPETLAKKKLFYNKTEKIQLDLIINSLKDKKFKELQKRLELKALPTGVAVLFHGAPGTGKTESVYQIAKATGRGIIKVDISQTKSMWFGESEKIIKRIFTNYEEIKKKSEICPILFFNEADAVISRRKDSASSNVAQTENTVQNILLEELENFKGILFATTNLADNLDKAFERRFLFKVDFSYPEEIVRANIWKSKLKGFSSRNYSVLANEFSFSGGQIDNIVRKAELFEVVEGCKAQITEIRNWCGEELINKNNSIKIGF